MKKGDQVKVYPHGKPAKAAIGMVTVLAENGRSIAVALGDSPPFKVSGNGVAILPEYGVMLLAHREAMDSPWVELFHGGHFEIEEI